MYYPDNSFECPYCGARLTGFGKIVNHYEARHPSWPMKFQDSASRKAYVLSERRGTNVSSLDELARPTSSQLITQPSPSSPKQANAPFYKIRVTLDREALARTRMLRECRSLRVQVPTVNMYCTQGLKRLASKHNLKRVNGQEISKIAAPSSIIDFLVDLTRPQGKSSTPVRSQDARPSEPLDLFLAKFGLSPSTKQSAAFGHLGAIDGPR